MLSYYHSEAPSGVNVLVVFDSCVCFNPRLSLLAGWVAPANAVPPMLLNAAAGLLAQVARPAVLARDAYVYTCHPVHCLVSPVVRREY